MNEVATIPVYAGGVGVVVMNRGKILMGNRKDKQGWCLPGGKRDILTTEHNHSLEGRRHAASRELAEEFGISISPFYLRDEGSIFSRAKVSGDYMNIYSHIFSFRYDVPEEQIHIKISEDEFLEYRWVNQEELHQLPIIFIPSLVAINIVMNKRWDFEAQIRNIEEEQNNDKEIR